MRVDSSILPQENALHPQWRELNAFTYLDPRIARRLDEGIGGAWRATEVPAAADRSPLAGCQIVAKDNIEVAGMPCTLGTPALRDHVATRDAAAIARLRAAGAEIVGKTNLHELAYGITSNNAAFGPVRNPHDLRCFAGGSSGGTAAAIAAGLVRAGLGTDTGGSSRIPAALCGIVGFRPTVARYPMAGVALISPTRDVIGPMGRTVRDVAALDAVLAGTPTAGLDTVDLRTIRIGFPYQHFQEDLDASVAGALEQAMNALREAGVTLVDADLANVAAADAAVSFPVVLYETRAALEAYLASTGSGLTLAELYAQIASPDVKEIMTQVIGGVIPEPVYREALTVHRPALRALYQDYFAEHRVEAILFPTTPLPARPIEGSDRVVTLNGASVPTFATYIRNTDPASNAGIPGISLPVGGRSPRDGAATSLPVAVELDGPADTDRRLLAIAAAIESVLRP
jgi:mandelamide amidase